MSLEPKPRVVVSYALINGILLNFIQRSIGPVLQSLILTAKP